MAKTRRHDAQDEAEVQENDGGLQYGMSPKALNSGQEHSDAGQRNCLSVEIQAWQIEGKK